MVFHPWILTAAGVAQDIVARRLTGFKLRRANLAPDLLTFRQPKQSYIEAPLCDFGTTVTLSIIPHLNGPAFSGTRVNVPRGASAASEWHEYAIANFWWKLQRLTYHQNWRARAPGDLIRIVPLPHLLLNEGGTSVEDQIIDVLQYAIARGVALQIGEIKLRVGGAKITPLAREITDQKCASVIVDQLLNVPDAVLWADYSTTPPTVYCRRDADLVSITLPAVYDPANKGSADIEIEELEDDRASAVALHYEKTNVVNGVNYYNPSHDYYPPGATGMEENALTQTVRLEGSQATVLTADGETAAVPLPSAWEDLTNPVTRSFWAAHFPSLFNDPRIPLTGPDALSIVPGSVARDGLEGFTNYLVPGDGGQLAAWMFFDDGSPVNWEKEEFTVAFRYKLYDEDAGDNFGQIEDVAHDRQFVQLTTCNVPAGDFFFWRVAEFVDGDPVPVGLAEFFYRLLNPVAYRGRLRRKSTEAVSLKTGMGARLNLSGSLAAHAAMNMPVQAMDIDLDAGEIVYHFGPAKTWDLGRVLQLQEAARTRRRWTLGVVQETGEIGEGEDETSPSLGSGLAQSNSVAGSDSKKYFAVIDGGKKVTLNATGRAIRIEDIGTPDAVWHGNIDVGDSKLDLEGANGKIWCRTALCNGKTLFPREETWCSADGTLRGKIMVLASEPYNIVTV